LISFIKRRNKKSSPSLEAETTKLSEIPPSPLGLLPQEGDGNKSPFGEGVTTRCDGEAFLLLQKYPKKLKPRVFAS